MTISSLPINLKAHILSFLGKDEKAVRALYGTSKEWKRIVQDKFLIQHYPELSKNSHIVCQFNISQITEVFRTLSLKGFSLCFKMPGHINDRRISHGHDPLNNSTLLQFCLRRVSNCTELVPVCLSTQGVDIHSMDASGKSPLYIAAEEGNEIAFMELIHKNVRCDLVDREGNMLLHCAAKSNSKIILLAVLNLYSRYRVELSSKINITNIEGKTPLLIAAEGDNPECVDLLIKMGSNVLHVDHGGNTLLHCASIASNKGIMYLALQHNRAAINSKNKMMKTPLINALFVESELNLSKHSKLMLDKRKKIKKDLVLSLLEAGADPNSSYGLENETALIRASRYGLVDVVECLLPVIDPNSTTVQGRIALMQAAKCRKAEVIDLLLKRGVDPNIQNFEGDTALIWAIKGGHEEAVETLLKHGVASHPTYLLIAVEFEMNKVLAVLLRFGFDPNFQDENGETALMRAAELGYREAVKILLESQADPNLIDNRGRTASMRASAVGCDTIVQILSNHGAEPKEMDNKADGYKIRRSRDPVLVTTILERWGDHASQLKAQADALLSKIPIDRYERVQGERASQRLDKCEDMCGSMIPVDPDDIVYLCLKEKTEKVEGVMVISRDKEAVGKKRYVSVTYLVTNPKNILHPFLPQKESERGAGSHLLKLAETIARVNHLSGVHLYPLREAMQFYYNFGFRPVSKKQRPDPSRIPMVKTLPRRPSRPKRTTPVLMEEGA